MERNEKMIFWAVAPGVFREEPIDGLPLELFAINLGLEGMAEAMRQAVDDGLVHCMCFESNIPKDGIVYAMATEKGKRFVDENKDKYDHF